MIEIAWTKTTSINGEPGNTDLRGSKVSVGAKTLQT
jgi:hypothetical protein